MSPATEKISADSACLIVIPARLHSTRLPRKLLLRETGKSLIQHTYESACLAKRPTAVCVATDAMEIFQEVRSFGGEVEMTGSDLQSGTDRVAEVASRRGDVDIFVNLQGDEPELSGEAIDRCVQQLQRAPSAAMSTLATPIRSRRQLEDPACVKVVFDHDGRALYFSRSVIPHAREWDEALLSADPPISFQHVGLYAYRRECLLQIAELPPAEIEKVERLEQLRVLNAGLDIAVSIIDEPTRGIDTAEDYRDFVSRWRQASRAA